MSADRFAPARTATPASGSATPNLGSGEGGESGLVTLSDFRKRRAELLDAQGREALLRSSTSANPARTGGGGGNSSNNHSTDGNDDGDNKSVAKKSESEGPGDAGRTAKRRKKIIALSFADDDDDENEDDESRMVEDTGENTEPTPRHAQKRKDQVDKPQSSTAAAQSPSHEPARLAANAALPVPKLQSRSALRREAQEREALRREFITLQNAVKATEIAIPFVFYDGTNLPGGTVRMKKGDPVWLFLDKGRKVGAALGTVATAVGKNGERTSHRIRREWARVSVDDLLMVRGTLIIPPHYEFYFFILNKSIGPGGRLLFDYGDRAPPAPEPSPEDESAGSQGEKNDSVTVPQQPSVPPLSALEGATDDPVLTKIVNRRWYDRNKHIYPASMWQEFDPEKDYTNEVRRDMGGNTFFYSSR